MPDGEDLRGGQRIIRRDFCSSEPAFPHGASITAVALGRRLINNPAPKSNLTSGPVGDGPARIVAPFTMTTQEPKLPHIPYEIRQLIWEFTLPPPRVFHVHSTPQVLRTERISPEAKRAFSAWFGPNAIPEDSDDETRQGFSCLNFKTHHPPPVITRVCRESRDCAIRSGYFLLPTLYGDGVDRVSAAWFNESSDLIYYPSRGAATSLGYLAGLPYFTIASIARVRSVAVGWWHFSSPLLENFLRDPPAEILQAKLRAIYSQMPAIQTLYIIHPDFRDPSRTREEPLDQANSELGMVMVPDPTMVFYDEEFKPWGHVVRDFYGWMDAEMVQRWRTIFGEDVCFPPEIVGCLFSGSTTDSLGAETLTSD